MYYDLTSLAVRLPEDIAKLKWFGDFEGAKRMIGLRLKKELPRMLRERLKLELLPARAVHIQPRGSAAASAGEYPGL